MRPLAAFALERHLQTVYRLAQSNSLLACNIYMSQYCSKSRRCWRQYLLKESLYESCTYHLLTSLSWEPLMSKKYYGQLPYVWTYEYPAV